MHVRFSVSTYCDTLKMGIDNKIEYLVVDTSAFIRNAAIQDIGINALTIQEVVNEITSKRQLRRLVVLPYDLILKDVFPENIQFVTEFAKKTGDYRSLSATDIKVIALTYQLEKEKVGISHLKEIPALATPLNVVTKSTKENLHNMAGFYLPRREKQKTDRSDSEKEKANDESDPESKESDSNDECDLENCNDDSFDEFLECSSASDYDTATSDVENEEEDMLTKKFATLLCAPEDIKVEGNKNVDDVLVPARTSNSDDGCDMNETDSEDESASDDDDGWITPGNIVKVKKQMDSDIQEEKSTPVACLTTDFAMQNVLKQIGLSVVSLDGRVIKQLRTFILRCYTCFKTTSIMTKEFCPSCGHKTLKKVSVSLDSNGKQRIHINAKKPLSSRGKRYSLPSPQGGKHAKNPILFEDQPRPDQRPTRLARTKTDPLNDDYIAGYSPFVMRDVNSKSAMLGIRSSTDIKHWMRKNPNEVRRKRK